MPAKNFQSSKVTSNELSSSTKFNNFVQAVEDAINSLDNANIAAAAAILVSKLAAGSNGQILATLAGVPTWMGGYATTLPGSPADGQRAVLVDSITLPTYQWEFRWNAGSSHADKWEFVGGASAFAEVGTLEQIGTSGSYVALATAGPSIALPRAGVYDVEIGAQIVTDNSDNSMSYDIGATGAVDADSFRVFDVDAGDVSIGQKKKRKTGLTAVTLTAKYKSNGTTSDFANRWMRVTPVRVS